MNDPCNNIAIRVMEDTDVGAAEELRQAAGWNQTPDDWRRLLQYEPDGCFVACINEHIVGTVTTTAYGTCLGWIGMMLVHSDYRRRGIATALMQTALGRLNQRQVDCIKLDATPAGEFVYRRLGFEPEWAFHRWMRDGTDHSWIRKTTQPEFCPPSRDRQAFGTDRSEWLRLVAADSLVVCDSDGFGMLRSGSSADYLGPVTATTRSAAGRIVDQLLSQTQRDVIWDVPGPNADAVELCREMGFRPVRDLTRMWTGRSLHSPDVSLQFALCDPGTG